MVYQQILWGKLKYFAIENSLSVFKKYSKAISFQNYDDSGSFWIDPVNSLLKFNSPELSNVGRAYNKPYHLDIYK